MMSPMRYPGFIGLSRLAIRGRQEAREEWRWAIRRGSIASISECTLEMMIDWAQKFGGRVRGICCSRRPPLNWYEMEAVR